MSTLSALSTNPDRQQKIAKSDLLRLEGLGDNCEFGFVLRRLGFEDGMLFRWASVRPESLLATLRGDFADLYEFKNLVPQNGKMVRDLHYGTCWHSQMYSSLQAGTLTFDADEDRRRTIHEKEASKLAYLLQKLRTKFENPNPVFVIKANTGIDSEMLEALHYQLYRRTTSPRFLLLEVQENTKRSGTTELLDRNRMRGYISHFASYDRSDEGDDTNWISILAQALAQYAEAPPLPIRSLTAGTPQIIALPFPDASAADLRSPVIGDLRGGMPSLGGGNGWCRMFDENTYRLHATYSDADSTWIQWTGVHLPADYVITIRAACAVQESAPVRATFKVLAADGRISWNQYTFNTTDEQILSVYAAGNLINPLTVTLSVKSVTPLKMGQPAVIDISSITAAPSAQGHQLHHG